MFQKSNPSCRLRIFKPGGMKSLNQLYTQKQFPQSMIETEIIPTIQSSQHKLQLEQLLKCNLLLKIQTYSVTPALGQLCTGMFHGLTLCHLYIDGLYLCSVATH